MSAGHRPRHTAMQPEEVEALERAAAIVVRAWGITEGARRAGITAEALRTAERRPTWAQARTRARVLAAAPAARAELERAAWEQSQRTTGKVHNCGSCGRRVRLGQDAPSSECGRCGRWLSRWGDVVAERGAGRRGALRCRPCVCCCACARARADNARRAVARGIAAGLRRRGGGAAGA